MSRKTRRTRSKSIRRSTRRSVRRTNRRNTLRRKNKRSTRRSVRRTNRRDRINRRKTNSVRRTNRRKSIRRKSIRRKSVRRTNRRNEKYGGAQGWRKWGARAWNFGIKDSSPAVDESDAGELAAPEAPLPLGSIPYDFIKFSVGPAKSFVDGIVENGVDLNASDAAGDTPLIYSAISGNQDVVNALVERGADVSHQNKAGNTPLHMAAIYGQANAVKALLENGADPNVTNNEKRTPYFYTGAGSRSVDAERGRQTELLLYPDIDRALNTSPSAGGAFPAAYALLRNATRKDPSGVVESDREGNINDQEFITKFMELKDEIDELGQTCLQHHSSPEDPTEEEEEEQPITQPPTNSTNPTSSEEGAEGEERGQPIKQQPTKPFAPTSPEEEPGGEEEEGDPGGEERGQPTIPRRLPPLQKGIPEDAGYMISAPDISKFEEKILTLTKPELEQDLIDIRAARIQSDRKVERLKAERDAAAQRLTASK